VVFTRLDASGSAIGLPTRVDDPIGESVSPSLVWTGREYGVAWSQGVAGTEEVYFARLDDQGARIGTTHRVTNAENRSVGPSLVWNGSEFAVVWGDERYQGTGLYFTRLDVGGNEQGDDLLIAADGPEAQGGRLAWTGGEYGFAWSDKRTGKANVYYRRLYPMALSWSRPPALLNSRGGTLSWNSLERRILRRLLV